MNYLLSHEELLDRANALMLEIKSKNIKLHIDRIFTLEQAKEAQKFLESRQSVGKILLKL